MQRANYCPEATEAAIAFGLHPSRQTRHAVAPAGWTESRHDARIVWRIRLPVSTRPCVKVSGEQIEILSDKEQGLREAYHAAHSAFDERKIVSGRSPDWRLRVD
jgi:hypothetical protein